MTDDMPMATDTDVDSSVLNLPQLPVDVQATTTVAATLPAADSSVLNLDELPVDADDTLPSANPTLERPTIEDAVEEDKQDHDPETACVVCQGNHAPTGIDLLCRACRVKKFANTPLCVFCGQPDLIPFAINLRDPSRMLCKRCYAEDPNRLFSGRMMQGQRTSAPEPEPEAAMTPRNINDPLYDVSNVKVPSPYTSTPFKALRASRFFEEVFARAEYGERCRITDALARKVPTFKDNHTTSSRMIVEFVAAAGDNLAAWSAFYLIVASYCPPAQDQLDQFCLDQENKAMASPGVQKLARNILSLIKQMPRHMDKPHPMGFMAFREERHKAHLAAVGVDGKTADPDELLRLDEAAWDLMSSEQQHEYCQKAETATTPAEPADPFAPQPTAEAQVDPKPVDE